MRPVPQISVIVCVRNGEETLLRQLSALAGQVNAPYFEVVIVDNGSVDGTRRVAETWCGEAMGAVAEATIVEANRRASIPYARNAGLTAARGTVIAFCDADDEVASDWVRVMADEARETMVQGRLQAVLVNGADDPKASAPGLRRTPYLPFGTTNNFAFPRQMLEAIGGFDESLPAYGAEDLEFSWRGQENGYLLRFCERAVVRYTVTPPRRALKKEFSIAKAHVAVAVRHPAARQLNALHSVSMSGAFADLAMLPIRLVHPTQFTRSRAAKLAIHALGTLAGYWTYVLRRKPVEIP